MYSYVCEFDLKVAGPAADGFLIDAVRSWPDLWESIPGVVGTLLLSSPFALGGEFAYQWRVDIERLSTLATIEQALQSDDPGWRRVRGPWFEARSAVRGHVSEILAGEEKYTAPSTRTAATHLVVGFGREDQDSIVESAAGATKNVEDVVAFQTQRGVLGSIGAASHESWLKLGGLTQLDEVAAAFAERGVGGARLFTEVREVEGSLFVGA